MDNFAPKCAVVEISSKIRYEVENSMRTWVETSICACDDKYIYDCASHELLDRRSLHILTKKDRI